MKKTAVFYLMMLFVGMNLSLTLASCSEDDDDNNGGDTHYPHTESAEAAAQWIGGTYDGVMGTILSSANFNNTAFPDTANQKVVVAYDSINHVSVTYKDWTNGGMNYGDLIVSPVTVTTADDGNAILLEGACKQMLYKGERGFEADVTVSGTVSPADKQCALVFTVNMPVSPAMTLDFTLNYNGRPE